jgi:flagellar hook-associated protein 1 FlgK
LDGFINGQLNSATASNGQVQQFYQLASQVDNLLSDPQAGLTPTLQNFFNAVQGVANDPTSIPARQVLLSGAQSLADRFHYLDQRLDSLRSGLNSQITNSVNEINNLAVSPKAPPAVSRPTICSINAMHSSSSCPRRSASPRFRKMTDR